MNRRIAANQESDIDDAHRKAEGAGTDGEVAVQMPASQKPPATGPAKAAAPARAKGKKAGGRGSGDVGQMLRGAYRQTVEEAVPDDLMDLLNKLE